MKTSALHCSLCNRPNHLSGGNTTHCWTIQVLAIPRGRSSSLNTGAKEAVSTHLCLVVSCELWFEIFPVGVRWEKFSLLWNSTYHVSLWHRLPLGLYVSFYAAPCSPQTSKITLVFKIPPSVKLSGSQPMRSLVVREKDYTRCMITLPRPNMVTEAYEQPSPEPVSPEQCDCESAWNS